MIYNCTLLNDSEPWCATHTFANDSYIPMHYAYCNKDCKGQIPDKTRPEHLGNPSYDNLWTSQVFNIHAWKAGVCHTYTPNEKFNPGGEGHLYALIGDGIDKPRRLLNGYEIYLHDRKVEHQINIKVAHFYFPFICSFLITEFLIITF